MIRGDWATRTDHLLRASRDHVIKVTDLIRLGVPEGTSYRRCQPGGPWRWLLPGIVMLSNGQPTTYQRVVAALLHGGPSAVVTGTEAARRHGLRHVPDDEAVHLLLPHKSRVRSSGFALVERTIHMPHRVMRDDIPLAPVDRAVLDAVRRWRATDPVRALLTEAVQRGKCRPPDLVAELDSGSRRGTALPRRVLEEVCAGARSVAEAHAMPVWHRADLPKATWNQPVHGADGQFIAVPDAWCDEVALAWEIDSFEWHSDAKGYARTVARNTRYTAAGIVVVQTLPSRLRDDPAGVISDLRAAYTTAAARPRPPVTLVARDDIPPQKVV